MPVCKRRSIQNVNPLYRFTGQEFDYESNLHNFKARLYDSDLGYFYQTDPLESDFGPYTYASNNPINLIDPTGMEPIGFGESVTAMYWSVYNTRNSEFLEYEGGMGGSPGLGSWASAYMSVWGELASSNGKIYVDADGQVVVLENADGYFETQRQIEFAITMDEIQKGMEIIDAKIKSDFIALGITMSNSLPLASINSPGLLDINFVGNGKKSDLSDYTMLMIRILATAAGEKKIKINSTHRTPDRQAEIMYNNFLKKDKPSYKSAGRQVEKLYPNLQAMKEKTRELGGLVSNHIGDFRSLQVFDILAKSISNKDNFVNVVKNSPWSLGFLYPPDDRSYHIEIPQP